MPRSAKQNDSAGQEDSSRETASPVRQGEIEAAETEEPSGRDRDLLPDEQDETSPGERQSEFLGFMLADEEYAIDILEIKEIIRLQNITPVPRTPDYLKGIITLRGVIVPIFDLRRRLGLKEVEHGPATRIVVVYRGEEFAGLIVDAITQVMRVNVDSIEPPPPTIGTVEAEFIRGVTRHQDRLVILLNLVRVLDVSA
jgi:purine-binding chemotaxis protein CheW